MQSKLIAGLVASMFITSIAAAQANPPVEAGKTPRHGHHLAKLDKDGDGFISREEAAGHPMLAKQFDAIDTNRDGKLAKEELHAARDAMRAQHRDALAAKFKQADKDGDGAISKAEAEAWFLPLAAKKFDAADTNRDGKLTLAEAQAARRDHAGPRHAKFEQRFKAADRDGDQVVTRAEAEAMAREGLNRKFERMDANRDGKLTLEEMQAGRHGHHGKGKV